MAEQQTCGMGLAENSPFPGALAKVVEQIADNLELHLSALDQDDEDCRNERTAYEALLSEHREIAERLKTTATKMASLRDLPMGRHDKDTLGNEEVRYAFKTLVSRE